MQRRGRKSDRTRNHKGIAWTGKVRENFIVLTSSEHLL
jgi:hypothetical protein